MSWSDQTMQELFEKLCECGKVLKWSVQWRKGLPADFAHRIQVPNILLYITTSEQHLYSIYHNYFWAVSLYSLYQLYFWAALLYIIWAYILHQYYWAKLLYSTPQVQLNSPAEQPFTVGAFVCSPGRQVVRAINGKLYFHTSNNQLRLCWDWSVLQKINLIWEPWCFDCRNFYLSISQRQTVYEMSRL